MGRRPELWDQQPAWEWDWAQEEPQEDNRQAGRSKQGQCRPHLGTFYKVGSQPVDSREGGGQVEGDGCGKTGRDSIIQKVLSCQAFRDWPFPWRQRGPKYLVGFLWKIRNPRLRGADWRWW